MRKMAPYENRENRWQVKKRTAAVLLFFSLALLLLTWRILSLHLFPDRRLERLARTQYKAIIQGVTPRGSIYDQKGEEMAVSVPTTSLAVRPAKVASPAELIPRLSAILKRPSSELKQKILSKKKYVWIERHLSPQELVRIKTDLDPGLELVPESRRYYPNRELASQILGAVGVDGNALGGLELAYDEVLRGEDPPDHSYRDARGQRLSLPETPRASLGEAHDIGLTLNKSIQYLLEKELEKTCADSQANSCTGVVMEARTGAILAMASAPSFNANSYEKYDWSLWKNRAVTDGFEPGSIFKLILAVAALESGAVRPEERFFCENGSLRIGKHLIHDTHPHGVLTFTEILKVSSNIGAFKVGQRLGKEPFERVIRLMGFGKKTGLDFPGEDEGFIRPASAWQEIDFANISFGQGIRVTPIQFLRAIAMIASGGYDVRPHFVTKVTSATGRTIWSFENAPRRVLKEETAKVLTRMMVEVTGPHGTGVRAAIQGYPVAGKTGTAQKVKNGQYSRRDYVSSFAGFAPAENPRIAAIVIVDEPRGEIYGGEVAAPLFSRVVWEALRELGVPPEGETGPILQASLTQARLAPLTDPITERLAVQEGVPDFRGLTLREVLSLLEQVKIPAEIDGTGVVYDQEPPPGGRLEKGKVCRVFLRSEP